MVSIIVHHDFVDQEIVVHVVHVHDHVHGREDRFIDDRYNVKIVVIHD